MGNCIEKLKNHCAKTLNELVLLFFLNGKLTEEIYMRHPNGFVESGSEDLVCNLNRSLYGFKQRPRLCNVDQCVYIRSVNDVKTMLAVLCLNIVLN